MTIQERGSSLADRVQRASLALVGIGKTFHEGENEIVVLNNANLIVNPGETVALLGPSGAGKSTLLQIAGLLDRPDAGEVYISGHACGRASDSERTRFRREDIGFVYQFHHLLPEFTAQENIALPQMINGLDKKEAMGRALELLSYMKMDPRARHRPSELSGGERQRVAIARAVANAPSVLMADEPTGNLDPKTSNYVFEALATLVKASGLAAIIATHNHQLAAKMDRRVTLSGGGVVELE